MTSEIKPGIVSIDDHYQEGNIFLVSNYRGLESFMSAPLPEKELQLAFISTGAKPYPEHGRSTRFLDLEREWLESKRKEGRIKYFEYCIAGKKPEDIANDLDGIDVMFMVVEIRNICFSKFKIVSLLQ